MYALVDDTVPVTFTALTVIENTVDYVTLAKTAAVKCSVFKFSQIEVFFTIKASPPVKSSAAIPPQPR